MADYGFLGLGIMGIEMARNLLEAGHTVHVWNRTPDRAGEIEQMGGVPKSSPAEVVTACDITFAMVSDPSASRDLCFDGNGVLGAMTAGKCYIDCSTIDPETSIEVAEAVTSRGGRYLEAPVSGSRQPAAEGTLVFLCGGDQSLFHEAQPAFQVMGKKAFYFGEAGSGARTKLVNNMIMGTMMTSLAEGLTLSSEAGLDPARVLEVLAEGAVTNPMFTIKGPLMLEGKFDTAFPLKHMEKDMRLALEMAAAHGRSLPGVAAARDTFTSALKRGLGDQDFCAVIRSVRGP